MGGAAGDGGSDMGGAAGDGGTGGTSSEGGANSAGGSASGGSAAGGASAHGGSSDLGGSANGGGSSTGGSASGGASSAALPGPWHFTSGLEGWTTGLGGTLVTYTGLDAFCAASVGCAELSGWIGPSPSGFRMRIPLDRDYDLSGAVITVSLKVTSSASNFSYAQAFAIDSEPVEADHDDWATSVARGNYDALAAGSTLVLTLPSSKVTTTTTTSANDTWYAGFNPAKVSSIGIQLGNSSANSIAPTIVIDSVIVTKP
jgi:hypothetical protein